MSEGKHTPEEPVVELLARLARNRIYGPLDMLSRVEDRDEFYMKMAAEALYGALRYASAEGAPVPDIEGSVRYVMDMIERRPRYAKGLALKALARAMSGDAFSGRASAEG
jgi:hypothetical protein